MCSEWNECQYTSLHSWVACGLQRTVPCTRLEHRLSSDLAKRMMQLVCARMRRGVCAGPVGVRQGVLSSRAFALICCTRSSLCIWEAMSVRSKVPAADRRSATCVEPRRGSRFAKVMTRKRACRILTRDILFQSMGPRGMGHW